MLNQKKIISKIHAIDLNFLGLKNTIAVYLIPHNEGAILIESGPGSTITALKEGLHIHGFSVSDITDVFLTHIHLDHAGAAGWLARQGAQIHVHPKGAPHLLDPEKLLNSATRIYGDQMNFLWGEFLTVPEKKLSIVEDGQVIDIGRLSLRALDTPGHANHHMAYICGDICFSGDIGGVRLPGQDHLRLPMPPPEFHLEKWRMSMERLKRESIAYIAPTHFGIFSDPDRHLLALDRALAEIEKWILAVMSKSPPTEVINDLLTEFYKQKSQQDHVSREIIQAYETANPTWMSAYGIERYWNKYHISNENQG